MIKKIQQYLLLNHPLLWNIRIVPILLGTISINIFFFCIGYFFTELDFKNYYSKIFSDNALIYFGAIVSSALTFIFWMIIYSKNNAFKVFYPKRSKDIYLEWILSFIIVFSMILYPFSFREGSIAKVKSYAGKEEVIKAVETLNMIQILIPEAKNDYFLEYPIGYNLPDFDHLSMKSTPSTRPAAEASIDTIIKRAEEQNMAYGDYPNFTPLSLLNYSGYNNIYIPDRYGLKVSDYKTVIQWLNNNEKEKIDQLMESFLALHEKNNLKTNITKDKWMQLVYNPNKYPVGDFNLISKCNIKKYIEDYSYYYSSDEVSPNGYYLQYRELCNGYETLMNAYMDTEASEAFILTSLYFALGISLLVFAFRISSGKSWLIALVSTGLILIVDLLVTLSIATQSDKTAPIFYITVLLILFIAELFFISNKIIQGSPKGNTNVIINHLIGFIPLVPIFIFIIIYIVSDQNCYSTDENCAYRYMDKHMVKFAWANVFLTFISMWYFVRFIVLKWKSLPEE